jgi:hypothetical protein
MLIPVPLHHYVHISGSNSAMVSLKERVHVDTTGASLQNGKSGTVCN